MASPLGSTWLRDPTVGNLGLLTPRGACAGSWAQDTDDIDPVSMPWIKPCPVPAAPATPMGRYSHRPPCQNLSQTVAEGGNGRDLAWQGLTTATGMDLETVGATLSAPSARCRSRVALADRAGDSRAGGAFPHGAESTSLLQHETPVLGGCQSTATGCLEKFC